MTGILAIPSYFFGLYWLANPDVIADTNGGQVMLNCWAPNQALAGNGTNFEILHNSRASTHLDYLNVTQGFLVWFEWGFLFFVIQAACVLSSLLMFCAPSLSMCSGLGFCCVSCGQSVWFIVGMVLRWRTAGNICSGASQMVNAGAFPAAEVPGMLYSSGKFMNVWLIITCSINGCLFLTTCCLGIAFKNATRE